MDMSKLPKLSQTPAPPALEQPAVAAETVAPRATLPAPAAGGAEAWISIGIGFLLLLLTPHTLGYFSSKLFHTRFEPYPDATRPAPAKCDFILFLDGHKEFYRDRPEFWSDLAVTAFALTLLLDGLVIVRARRPMPVLCVFCITAAATVGNLFYLLKTMNSGLPLISAFAVIFGGYIAMYQWKLYQTMKMAEARPTT